jgi:putative addiction module component (TIGR02574 family)
VPNLDPVVYNCESATEVIMSTTADRLASEIRDLPDAEKLRLVDAILTDLDKPDPEIDRIWAEEARKRWAAYKAGEIPTVAYEDVMAKHTRE